MKKIMIAGEKYTTKDGQEKVQWHEVGVIMTSQTGKEFVLLDPKVNLAGFPREPGKDKLIASIFDDVQHPQQKQGYQNQQPQQGYPQATPQNNMDDPSRHNINPANRPPNGESAYHNNQGNGQPQIVGYTDQGAPIYSS